MNKILFAFLTLIISASSLATPSKTWQSAEEIQAILANQEFRHRFSSDGKTEITSVTKKGSVYSFTSSDCTINVTVNYSHTPSSHESLAFDISVGFATCLPGDILVDN